MSSNVGHCFIISAPSGSGKTTLIQAVMEKLPNLSFLTSCTTRQPRAGEKEGKDYFFLSRAAFEKKIAAGEFLETATVHGELYGTPKQEFFNKIKGGSDVVLEIDVQGAIQV